MRERDESSKKYEANTEVVQKEREVFQQLLTQIENLEKQLGGSVYPYFFILVCDSLFSS